MASMQYSKEILAEPVANSDSLAGVMRYLQKPVTGSRYNHLSLLITEYELDTSHFTFGKAHRISAKAKRKAPEEILIVITEPFAKRAKPNLLTRAMMELGVPYECSSCQVSEWQGKPLVLDVDHVDGNWLDCRLENLRFLCPNCHRQTPTFGRQKTVNSADLICGCGNSKQKRSRVCSSCYTNRKRS